jgi:hypothetical protein
VDDLFGTHKLTGLPVLSAATATAQQLLDTLGFEPDIDGAGALLGPPLSAGTDSGHSSASEMANTYATWTWNL